MKKLAIVSMVLLLAGIGMAFGHAVSCICPSSASCPQTGCIENCSGSCALGANDTSSCAASCPNANCGSDSESQGCCAHKSVACCGATYR